MKPILATLSILTAATALASSPPRYSCTNQSNTIQIDFGRFGGDRPELVRLATTRQNDEFVFETIPAADLKISKVVLTQLPEETRGCTMRQVELVRYTLSRKDSKPLPHVYNRLTDKDGSLNDVFLCQVSQAWMPTPGQKCPGM